MSNISGTTNSFHPAELRLSAIDRKTASQPEDGSMSDSETDRVEGIDLRKRKVKTLGSEQETKAGPGALHGKKARKVGSPTDPHANFARLLQEEVPTDARLGDAAIAQRVNRALDAVRGLDGDADALALLLGALLDHLAPVAGQHPVQVRTLLTHVVHAEEVEALFEALCARSEALAPETLEPLAQVCMEAAARARATTAASARDPLFQALSSQPVPSRKTLEILCKAHAQQLVNELPAGEAPERLASRVQDLLRQACRLTARMDKHQIASMGGGLVKGLGGRQMDAHAARAALQGVMAGLPDMGPQQAYWLVASLAFNMGGRTIPEPLLRELVATMRSIVGDAVPASKVEAARKGACRGLGQEATADAGEAFDICVFLFRVGPSRMQHSPQPALPELAPGDVGQGKLALQLHVEWRKLSADTPGLALRFELAALALAPSFAVDSRVPDDVGARRSVLTAFLARESSDSTAPEIVCLQRGYVLACRLGLPGLPEAEQRQLVLDVITHARAQPLVGSTTPALYGTLAGVLTALAVPLAAYTADADRLRALLAWTLPLCLARAPQPGAASPLARHIERSISMVMHSCARVLRQPEQLVQAALDVLVTPASQLPLDDARRWIALSQSAAAVAEGLGAGEQVCNQMLEFALRSSAGAPAFWQRLDVAQGVAAALHPQAQGYPERLLQALRTVSAQEHASPQEIGFVALALCAGSLDVKREALLKSIRGFALPQQARILMAFPTQRAVEQWRSLDDALCSNLATPPSAGARFPGEPLTMNERRQLSIAYALGAGVRDMSEDAYRALRARFAPSPQQATDHQRICLSGVGLARKPVLAFRVSGLEPAQSSPAEDDPRLQLFMGMLAVPGMLTRQSLPTVLSDAIANVLEPLLRMATLAALFRQGAEHASTANFVLAWTQVHGDLLRIEGELAEAPRVETKGEQAPFGSEPALRQQALTHVTRVTQALKYLVRFTGAFARAEHVGASAAERREKSRHVESAIALMEEATARHDRRVKAESVTMTATLATVRAMTRAASPRGVQGKRDN